jgi:hypothetical protein
LISPASVWAERVRESTVMVEFAFLMMRAR